MQQKTSKTKRIEIRPAKRAYISSFLLIIIFIFLVFITNTQMEETLNQQTVLFLSLLFWIFAVITLIYIILKRYVKKLIISSTSLVLEEGILHKHHLTVSYPNITEIGANQKVFARMLNYGDLYIRTSGSNKKEFTIEKISHPLDVKKLIEYYSGLHR